MKELVDKLKKEQCLKKDEWIKLIKNQDKQMLDYIISCAKEQSAKVYGNKVYIRALIEMSNYCKNNCFYCGIRKSNKNANRYRLDENEIINCCEEAYKQGFRTFVLQSGEDEYFTDDYLCELIRKIKDKYPDCALTLSLGEKSKTSYESYFKMGADRYLLRHESANCAHYKKLHPPNMKLANRIDCLNNLKEIGFQTGCGFMVGSPFQTTENLAEDMMFISEFKPHMVGIGPFIPHKDTPFRAYEAGSARLTLLMLALVRLAVPNALIPATTALRSIEPKAYVKGVLAGANVVMLNFSPEDAKSKYSLYDNKICSNSNSLVELEILKEDLKEVGYEVSVDIGNCRIV